MADPFIGEIKIVGFNFPPRGWAFCDGQLLSIAQNTALFSILGTTYGGNGQSTFGLPNLQGRAPMHFGQGPGLTPYSLGETSGQETVTLTSTQIPLHNHGLSASSVNGSVDNPTGAIFASSGGRGRPLLYATGGNQTQMAATQVGGGSQPHENVQPYLALNFIIALQGVFPARN